MNRSCTLAALALIIALPLSAATADDCQQANADDGYAEGELTTQDGAFILKLDQPLCLAGDDEFDQVAPTSEVHVFSAEGGPQAELDASIGKKIGVTGRMFGAMTRYHKAPIMLEALTVTAK